MRYELYAAQIFFAYGGSPVVANAFSVARSDTITASLTAILYHTLRHPKCVSQLNDEVPTCQLGEHPSSKDVINLPYLGACIKEDMRLTSPFSGPKPRLPPPEGLSIGDKYIPPGTVINVMHCQVHKDERIFGNANATKPERWLNGQGKELDKFFLGVRWIYILCS